MNTDPCVFCEILAGRAPATIVAGWPDVQQRIYREADRAGLRAAIAQHLAEQAADPSVRPGVRLTRYRWVHPDGINAKCDLASALTAVAEHGGRVDRSYVIAHWDQTETLGAWETYIPDGAVVQVGPTEPAEPLAPSPVEPVTEEREPTDD